MLRFSSQVGHFPGRDVGFRRMGRGRRRGLGGETWRTSKLDVCSARSIPQLRIFAVWALSSFSVALWCARNLPLLILCSRVFSVRFFPAGGCSEGLLLEGEDDAMYSWMLRVNTVLTLSVTVLAVLCAVASMTDGLHRTSPDVELEVLSVGPLERLRNGDDRIALSLSIKADLESVFTWNTKQLFVFVAAEYWSPEEGFNQISLWDTIIEKKENAKIDQQIKSKLLRKATRVGYFTYPFQGKDLKGRDFNLTMYWNVMPVTGAFFTNKVVVPGFQLPKSYN